MWKLNYLIRIECKIDTDFSLSQEDGIVVYCNIVWDQIQNLWIFKEHIKAFCIFQYYTTVLGSSRIMYVVYWWYDELYIIALDIKLIS